MDAQYDLFAVLGWRLYMSYPLIWGWVLDMTYPLSIIYIQNAAGLKEHAMQKVKDREGGRMIVVMRFTGHF